LRVSLHGGIVVVIERILRHIPTQEETMTPSRRQFVASIATVPFLVQSTDARQRAATGADDPTLDQIVRDLRDLTAEFEAQPASRKAALRAFESTLGIGAAHLATRYDADFQSALRRRQRRQGRTALVQDLVNQAHERKNHNVSYDTVDAALTRLEQRGLAGCWRDMQQTVRKIRLQAPEPIQAAALRSQFDYCSDLSWMINMMEGIVAIACGIAILEPTIGGEIICGALTLALGMLMLQRAFFC
jgi:hypothetical protein